MKVVLLAGGMGTRLHEETESIPKPMVNIGNRPILWHIMKIYAHQGYNEFIICLGYKGQVIKRYFFDYEVLNNDLTITLGSKREVILHNSHGEENWKITLASTGDKTLKGGRIKKIEKHIEGDTFMLTYGDGVANIDLKALVEFHRAHGKIGTVTGVRPPSRFGELMVKQNLAVHFSEKPQTSAGLINGGFFVFDRKIFDYLTPDEDCDFEKGPLEDLARKGELMVYIHQGQWECMDTYRDLNHLNKLWDQGRAFWKLWE